MRGDRKNLLLFIEKNITAFRLDNRPADGFYLKKRIVKMIKMTGTDQNFL